MTPLVRPHGGQSGGPLGAGGRGALQLHLQGQEHRRRARDLLLPAPGQPGVMQQGDDDDDHDVDDDDHA